MMDAVTVADLSRIFHTELEELVGVSSKDLSGRTKT